MKEIKLGIKQNEFYKFVGKMIQPLGLFNSLLVGEKDNKIFLVFVPSVLYEDVVNKYREEGSDRDLEDIRYLAEMPNDSELSDKNFFFGVAQNILKTMIRKVVGDGRTEYIPENSSTVLQEEE